MITGHDVHFNPQATAANNESKDKIEILAN